MGSPIAIGFDSLTDEHNIVRKWRIGEYRIYEDAKGILRWNVTKVVDISANSPTGRQLGREETATILRTITQGKYPVVIHRRGWGNIKPDSAVTRSHIYILFPNEETALRRMPFPILKDWIKDQIS